MLKINLLKKLQLFVLLSFSILNSCSSYQVNQKKDLIVEPTKSPIITISPIVSPIPNKTTEPIKNNTESLLPTPQATSLSKDSGQILLDGVPVPKPSIIVATPVPDNIHNLKNDVITLTPSISMPSPITRPSEIPLMKINKGDRLVYTLIDNNNINQIYSINKDGSDRKKVSLELKNQNMPSFSLDGTKIFFVNTLVDNSNDIYKSNIDGTKLERLTNLAQKVSYPKISEQNRLLYVFNNQLYMIETDNSIYQISKSDNKISQPKWVNNNKIAFLSSNNNFSGNIFTIDVNGNDIKQITTLNDIASFDMRDDVIVYSNIFGLWISNSNYENNKKILEDGFIKEVALSPDKTKIAFTSTKAEKRQVYIVNIDGTNLIKISDDRESFEPSW
ncbi:MAG: hypothetical protein U0354_00755 [Candidatus Sericytochromatia bacterium]